MIDPDARPVYRVPRLRPLLKRIKSFQDRLRRARFRTSEDR
jgi:hypothetical protein